MPLLKTLIGLPVLIVILLFAFVNNDLATFSLWPFAFEVTVSLSVAVVFFILLGFFLGHLFSWMSYAPVRKALRQHKKQCKKLNKEQQRLVREMEDLHEDLENIKAKEALLPKPSFKEKLKNWFKSEQNEPSEKN